MFTLVNVTFVNNRGSADVRIVNDTDLVVAFSSIDTASDAGFDLSFGSGTSTFQSTVTIGAEPFFFQFTTPDTFDFTAANDAQHVPAGTGNLFLSGIGAAADPFVRTASGQLFVAQTGAGQGFDSIVVDAGDASIAAQWLDDWDARTTRLDGAIDTGPPDLGAHYDPMMPVVYDVVLSGGIATWSERNVDTCTFNGFPVTSPMAIPAPMWSLVCRGDGGNVRAWFQCAGDPANGDADLDGVCDP